MKTAGMPEVRALVSRRAFVEGVAASAGAVAALALPASARGTIWPAVEDCPPYTAPAADAAAASAARANAAVPRTPVVTFYMDRPYLDWTGTAEPYIPPAGARSGQPLADLSDEAFFSCHPY